jgi:hypothetical protein
MEESERANNDERQRKRDKDNLSGKAFLICLNYGLIRIRAHSFQLACFPPSHRQSHSFVRQCICSLQWLLVNALRGLLAISRCGSRHNRSAKTRQILIVLCLHTRLFFARLLHSKKPQMCVIFGDRSSEDWSTARTNRASPVGRYPWLYQIHILKWRLSHIRSKSPLKKRLAMKLG